jgi:hypothetical protein
MYTRTAEIRKRKGKKEAKKEKKGSMNHWGYTCNGFTARRAAAAGIGSDNNGNEEGGLERPQEKMRDVARKLRACYSGNSA